MRKQQTNCLELFQSSVLLAVKHARQTSRPHHGTIPLPRPVPNGVGIGGCLTRDGPALHRLMSFKPSTLCFGVQF